MFIAVRISRKPSGERARRIPVRTRRVAVSLADWVFIWYRSAVSWLAELSACAGRVGSLWCMCWQIWVELLHCSCKWSCCCGDLLMRAELWVMLACWRPAFLYRCRWAARGPVEDGAEVMGTDWLALVWVCRQPGRNLQCINTACACYTLSVWPKEFGCLYDCVTEGVWLSVWPWEVPTGCYLCLSNRSSLGWLWHSVWRYHGDVLVVLELSWGCSFVMVEVRFGRTCLLQNACYFISDLFCSTTWEERSFYSTDNVCCNDIYWDVWV
jgi:hypothetical protein